MGGDDPCPKCKGHRGLSLSVPKGNQVEGSRRVESKPESADRLQNLTRSYRNGDRWQEADRGAFLKKASEEGLELEGAKSLVDEILSPGHPQEESVRATLLSKSLLQALAVLQMKDRGRLRPFGLPLEGEVGSSGLRPLTPGSLSTWSL